METLQVVASANSNTFFFLVHRRQVLLCVLAKDCNEAEYVRLVEALCNEHQIKLLKVGTISCLIWDQFARMTLNTMC